MSRSWALRCKLCTYPPHKCKPCTTEEHTTHQPLADPTSPNIAPVQQYLYIQ